ncbi:MAG: hypothetical protein H6668_07545 [Ardenticatenaceae bacterium]|nr:hypothetical protein [Ardenticatenaceae bacterium]
MAKAKRVQRVREPRVREPQAAATEAQPAAEKSKRLSSTEQFQQEYAYVLKDLRFIFALAGIMFALLVIINLVLR